MQTESACPTPEALADLLANALPAAEAERLRLHLAGCPHCLERVSRDPQRDVPRRLVPPAATSEPGHSFPFLAPAEAEGELGRLGGYRILGLLGEGGMAYVFDAEETVLHRRVALKVLKPGMCGASLRQRFLQEARLAAGLPHDHIAAVFQVGQVEVPGQGEVPYLAMEQLRGESLEGRLRRDRWLPLDEALRITREAAEGLVVAHARGLIHRDIKPGNLWLERRPGAAAARDRVKILDFGLARALDGPSDITRHGQVLGTPSYMAPEQALGVPVDQRADLYSLGCVLYRMLAGVAPFEDAAHDTVALLEALARWAPKPVTELAPQTPRPVALLVEQLLARNPADRPASARAVVERLRALERGEQAPAAEPPPAPAAGPGSLRRRLGWGVWAGGLTVLLAVVLGLVFGLLKLLGPADESAGPGAPEAGAPAGEPIKVGVLHSLTETVSFSERPLIEAAQLAIDDVNRAGGVLGRPLEAVIEDGASDAEVFAEKAEKLLEQDGVVTIFGCWTSASRKRVEAVCARHDRLLLFPCSYEGLEESKNVFYLGGVPNQVLLPVAHWAYAKLHKRKYFLVGSESVYSKGAHAILGDELKRLGAAVVGDAYVPLGENDFTAVVGRIKAAKPDMILNTVEGLSNVNLLKALRDKGIQPPELPAVWFNVSEHELHYLGERRMIGDYSAASYFQSVDSPANRAFVKRFQDRFGKTRGVNDAMQTAYHGVLLWKQAAEAAKSLETGPLRESMKRQQIEAPEGPMRIDGPTQHTWRMARIGQVVAGRQFKVVAQEPEALRPEPFPATRTRAQWEKFLADLYRGWGDRWERHAH